VYSPIPLTISEKTWQKLSPADRDAVTKAEKEASDWSRKEVSGNDDRQLKEMESKGAKIARPNIGPWREVVKPVYEQARAKYGADVDAILADAAEVRKALPAK
jgi:TRAP-type C4-dicarboxylate transport system substrate-binding protein